jgi:F0F1-type ATP synthase gamma subunit
MPDIRKVRRRIRGVRNISKITRAMEMIAASKMRKAQERGLQGRPYSPTWPPCRISACVTRSCSGDR